MDISCAFPPVPATPDHVALAERLGYRRAWVYDTPALQLDVWATLARAAERTRRIELGPGVLIPSLRHVLVNAAAVATLVDLAPGRVNVGIGSGFTGRLAMGQRPSAWSLVARPAPSVCRSSSASPDPRARPWRASWAMVYSPCCRRAASPGRCC